MDVRAYLPTDRDACLEVFDSNLPDYFQPSERAGFDEFLSRPACPYYVMEHDGTIAGCGGYYVTADPSTARLTWGMVRRQWHRQGLGRFLLLFRLREISKAGDVRMVGLATSPLAARFYQSQGFKIAGARGELVELAMKLAVCA